MLAAYLVLLRPQVVQLQSPHSLSESSASDKQNHKIRVLSDMQHLDSWMSRAFECSLLAFLILVTWGLKPEVYTLTSIHRTYSCHIIEAYLRLKVLL